MSNKPTPGSDSLNKAFSVRQSELWDAYLEQIKDLREANDVELAQLTKEYNESIQSYTDDYNMSIKPEYEATQKIVNPKIKQMEKKLAKIKERATKQTNEVLQEFAKWRDKILAEVEPQIADRLAKHKADIKPFEDEYNEKCKVIQSKFEEATKPFYEEYLKEAEKIEEEFKRIAANRAAAKTDRWDIKTDRIVEAQRGSSSPTITSDNVN